MTPQDLCASMGHMPRVDGTCLCGKKSYLKLSELTLEQREAWANADERKWSDALHLRS